MQNRPATDEWRLANDVEGLPWSREYRRRGGKARQPYVRGAKPQGFRPEIEEFRKHHPRIHDRQRIVYAGRDVYTG